MILCKPLPDEDLRHVLTHAESSFRELNGARIFITGGTGFFGIWLLESLVFAARELNLSLEVTVLTRNKAQTSQRLSHLAALPWLHFYEGDILTFQPPPGAYTHCIHAATAASAQLSRDEPLTMFDTCLSGTRRALEFSAAAGVSRFLFTSSGAVHGPQPAHLKQVPEDWLGGPDPLLAASCYAEGKRAAEHLCTLWARQSSVQPVVARCWAFIGPHLPMDAHFAAGNFLGNALRGQPIHIAGDGTAERSYLYAADLATWLWTLLVKAPPLRAFNVGSGQSVSILQLAETAAGAVTPALPVTIAGIPVLGAVPARYVPDVSRASAELGLMERIPLADGFRRTLEWLRNKRFYPAIFSMKTPLLKSAARPCPVCGAAAVNVVSSQRFELPAGHPLPSAWDVVTCPQCGFAYADTPASQEVYDHYYTDFSKYEDDATSTGGGASPTDRQRLEDTAALISQYAGPQDSILDLGCANGGLLAAFLKLGYTRLTGVDPSPVCAAATEALGVEGLAGSLFAPPLDGRTFHAVSLCHVLEHIRDLSSAVDVLLGVVAPQGYLYVEVPDANRYGGYSSAPFQDFNVEHINHFSHASLANLFESRGFTTVNQGIRDIPTVAGWTYPAIWILLRREGAAAPASYPWKKDPALLASLEEYTAVSLAQITKIDEILAPWVASQEPVVMWGVGQLTLKLLAQSTLAKCNIAAFFDTNPGHYGKLLRGVEVLRPEALRTMHHPAIIGSMLHHKAIRERIVSEGDPDRSIITFS